MNLLFLVPLFFIPVLLYVFTRGGRLVDGFTFNMMITCAISIIIFFALMNIGGYISQTLMDEVGDDTDSGVVGVDNQTNEMENKTKQAAQNITDTYDDVLNIVMVAAVVMVILLPITAILGVTRLVGGGSYIGNGVDDDEREERRQREREEEQRQQRMQREKLKREQEAKRVEEEKRLEKIKYKTDGRTSRSAKAKSLLEEKKEK